MRSSATEKNPYAIERYQREVRRLLEVLDHRLADHEYLAGDYSIAEIVEALAHVQRWIDVIGARPVEGARKFLA